ncbi:MAG: hypothetical protein ABI359_13685 [Ginsengibacter sp.]
MQSGYDLNNKQFFRSMISYLVKVISRNKDYMFGNGYQVNDLW